MEKQTLEDFYRQKQPDESQKNNLQELLDEGKGARDREIYRSKL